jgi:hypothetical protein
MRVLQVSHQGGVAGSVTSTLHLSVGLANASVDGRLVRAVDPRERFSLVRRGNARSTSTRRFSGAPLARPAHPG